MTKEEYDSILYAHKNTCSNRVANKTSKDISLYGAWACRRIYGKTVCDGSCHYMTEFKNALSKKGINKPE